MHFSFLGGTIFCWECILLLHMFMLSKNRISFKYSMFPPIYLLPRRNRGAYKVLLAWLLVICMLAIPHHPLSKSNGGYWSHQSMPFYCEIRWRGALAAVKGDDDIGLVVVMLRCKVARERVTFYSSPQSTFYTATIISYPS